MHYEFHQIANIFPMLDSDKLAELAADINAKGQTEPIVIYEDKILDGRNRYRACELAGVAPLYRLYTGDDPLGYVISLNLKRRHLDASQLAMVAANIANLKNGQTKAGAQICAASQADAAEMVNVSRRSVQHAVNVKNSDNKELARAVTDRTLSVSLAAQVAALPKEIQAEIVKNLDKKVVRAHINEAKRTRREAAQTRKLTPRTGALPPNCTLHHCDLADAPIEPNSVDYIITDPPYPHEFLPLYGVLARKAAIWLKPGGSLIAMAGQSYLPDVMRELESSDLSYQWLVAYLTQNGQSLSVHNRSVNTFWKPVFWGVKGKYAGGWIGDVAESKGNDKSFHHWGQSESGFADLIERFTRPRDVICDPFMGGGTTGVAALALGRSFVGVEIDANHFATAKTRLEGVEYAQAA